MELDEKEALFILPEDGFRDEEVDGLTRVFETEGIHITYASPSGGDARGVGGLFISVDAAVSDVEVERYDLVVVIGCSGSEDELTHQAVRSVVEEALERGAVVGSVCLATAVLASFGLLEDMMVAVPAEVQLRVGDMVGRVSPGDIARSDNMFTCASDDEVEEMAERIVTYIRHASEHGQR